MKYISTERTRKQKTFNRLMQNQGQFREFYFMISTLFMDRSLGSKFHANRLGLDIIMLLHVHVQAFGAVMAHVSKKFRLARGLR